MITPFTTGLVATLALASWAPLTAVSAQEQTPATAERGSPGQGALEGLFEHLDADGDGQIAVRPDAPSPRPGRPAHDMEQDGDSQIAPRSGAHARGPERPAHDNAGGRRLPAPRAGARQPRSGQAPHHPPPGPGHAPPPRGGREPGPDTGPRQGRAGQPMGPHGHPPRLHRAMPPMAGPNRGAPAQRAGPNRGAPPQGAGPRLQRPGTRGTGLAPRAGGPPPSGHPGRGSPGLEFTPLRAAMTQALLQSADGNDDGMVSSAEWQEFCSQLRAVTLPP